MNILLKNVKIIDSESNDNGTTQDIRIKEGLIVDIGKGLQEVNDEKIIAGDNLAVSQGWFDSSVSFGQPGFEERETIAHGLTVAAHSGFTAVALNPSTNPIIDTSSDVAFVQKMAEGALTQLFPIGALSLGSSSENLAELYDMQQAGAVAFGDYQTPIANPNLLKIALQYSQGFKGLILSFPQEDKIAGNGVVHEGVESTNAGLKGIPALAESLQVARDLHILEYAGGRLHIPTISTAESVSLIRIAKSKGLDITCSVAIHNLLISDFGIRDFDTQYKVKPPLRSEYHIDALIDGIKDGTIDMVTSDHYPLDVESKHVEFDNAAYGTTALEPIFSALLTKFDAQLAIKLLTNGRYRFTKQTFPIKLNSPANLTIFKPEGLWQFKKEHILSKSKNSVFIDAKMKGQVIATVANNTLVRNKHN